MLTVIVSNRLWVPLDDLTKEQVAWLRDAFEYSNPAFFKAQAMGHRPTEPARIRSWKHVDDDDGRTWFTMPRGGTTKWRDFADEFDVDYEFVNAMSAGSVSAVEPIYTGDYITPQLFPDPTLTMWAHQQRLVDAILRVKQGVFRSPTGCITGDTKIGISRGGKGAQVRLDHIVKMHNGGKSCGRSWDPDIPTMVRARLGDGRVGLVRLVDAYESGIKPVWRVTMSSGHTVVATKDHRFLTEIGWRSLESIEVGHYVYVEPTRQPQKKAVRKRKPAVMTQPALVKSIEYVGERPTYDLSLESPHNFLANGVVVHNSGKTSALIAAIQRANVPALVIMWETSLLEQWQQRIAEEMGVPEREQGIIQGSQFRLRPITLAMQQTINRWGDEKWKRLNGVFGFIGCDECQRYAATTFTKTIDRFDSAYRVGVSADERRTDGKTFLIYDHFGQVALEIEKKELVDKGLIHDVRVDVMRSQFEADWYDPDEDYEVQVDKGNFTRLLDEMTADDERNELIVQVAKERYDAGEVLLLFSHRIEHCYTLRTKLAEVGVPAGFMLGGKKNQGEFKSTVSKMRKGTLRCAVGTLGKVGVGLDIPALTCGIATTPIHSNRPFLNQVKGRICRKHKGKTHADIIYVMDDRVFGRYPLFNLRRWNDSVRVRGALGQWHDVESYLKELPDEDEKPDDEDAVFVSANNRRARR